MGMAMYLQYNDNTGTWHGDGFYPNSKLCGRMQGHEFTIVTDIFGNRFLKSPGLDNQTCVGDMEGSELLAWAYQLFKRKPDASLHD